MAQIAVTPTPHDESSPIDRDSIVSRPPEPDPAKRTSLNSQWHILCQWRGIECRGMSRFCRGA
jgi:hypothetical protein